MMTQFHLTNASQPNWRISFRFSLSAGSLRMSAEVDVLQGRASSRDKGLLGDKVLSLVHRFVHRTAQ